MEGAAHPRLCLFTAGAAGGCQRPRPLRSAAARSRRSLHTESWQKFCACTRSRLHSWVLSSELPALAKGCFAPCAVGLCFCFCFFFPAFFVVVVLFNFFSCKCILLLFLFLAKTGKKPSRSVGTHVCVCACVCTCTERGCSQRRELCRARELSVI